MALALLRTVPKGTGAFFVPGHFFTILFQGKVFSRWL